MKKYMIYLDFTLDQDVWILPFSVKGKIVEIHLMRGMTVYEVRHIRETSIAISFLYQEELEEYKEQDIL